MRYKRCVGILREGGHSLIAEADAARAKAMSEKGGAAAAVSALTAKAKLAGMWRDKVDQHNTGTPAFEHI
jgi:hypothetical protein